MQWAFAQKVNVQMRDGFAAVGAAVDHKSEAAVSEAEFACNFGGGEEKFSEQWGVVDRSFIDPWDRFFRYNEHVNRSLRIDVVKGENVVVFKSDFGRNFACDEFFEQSHG